MKFLPRTFIHHFISLIVQVGTEDHGISPSVYRSVLIMGLHIWFFMFAENSTAGTTVIPVHLSVCFFVSPLKYLVVDGSFGNVSIMRWVTV